MEGTSYRTEVEGESPVLISLRYPEISAEIGDRAESLSSHTLQTFTQLTQQMAASLDLEETIQAVMSNIEKLIPADFLEITIWDEENQSFIPYRFSGPSGIDRRIELISKRYAVENTFPGRLYHEQTPLLYTDVEFESELWPIVEHLPVTLRSYLGFPLMIGSEFIGTLAIGSPAPEIYHEQDLDLVRLLSGQAAIAVHNALLYRAEQQRTEQLSGLARLTQAFSSARDPSSFYARLVESIAPLIKVEILGYLLYNENTRSLEGKIPFRGIPDQVVELYRAPIVTGSPAEQILIHQELLITENASEDEKWEQLGISHLALAASLHETVLVPLTTGGRMLGYLQASNHTEGSAPFTQSEVHLLTIIANQTASIIENASLLQQSRLRAQRAEALRRIANLASSTATLDEILQYSLQELGRLLRSDVGAMFLINPEHGLLELHRPSVISSADELPERLTHILLEDPQFPFTVTGSQHVFNSKNIPVETQPVIPFYQSIIGVWKLESMVAVPLIVRDEGIGELWFGSHIPEFFDYLDLQAVTTAASQLAGVVEQSFLGSQTDESLRRRVEQMTAITRINRELSTSLDLNYLMQLVYDEALRTTGADCGTILLFHFEEKQDGQVPAIRFYVGDVPDPALTSLEQMVLERDLPQLVSDFSRSEFQPPHESVQSMLVAPISYQQRHAGLISLHGNTANQFDQTSLEITQSLAIQAAVALNNAIAYEEQTRRGTLLRREVETLSHLIDVTRTIRPTDTLSVSLTRIAEGIRSATPFQVVLISVYDPAEDALRRMAGCGLTDEKWAEAKAHRQSLRGVQQILQPEFKVGEAYYIPQDKMPSIPEDVYVVSVFPADDEPSSDSWHPEDMLVIPLYDSASRPLGLISVDAPRDQRKPDRPTFEALELFAAQAGLVIESFQRTHSLETQLEELEAGSSRLEMAARAAQAHLPLLLHKELEQNITLRGLNQRIDRVRATLEIAAQANRQETQADVLHTLASEMLTRFAMQVALVAEHTPAGIKLIEVIGNFPPGANPDALFGQRNPLRHLLHSKTQRERPAQENDLILVSSLENDPEWQNVTMLNVLEAHSMIGLKVELGSDQTAAVLVISQRTLPAFLDEDRRVFAQLAHQVSVGLQNLQLLNEMRRRLREVKLAARFLAQVGQPGARGYHDLTGREPRPGAGRREQRLGGYVGRKYPRDRSTGGRGICLSA